MTKWVGRLGLSLLLLVPSCGAEEPSPEARAPSENPEMAGAEAGRGGTSREAGVGG